MSDGVGSLPTLASVMLHIGAADPDEQRRLLAHLGDAADGLHDLALVELLSLYMSCQPRRLQDALIRSTTLEIECVR